jgi:hypothetical protein
LAAVLALAANTYFQYKSAQNDLVKDYLEDLKEIEKLSVQYWLGDHQSDRDALKRAGVELRARLNATGIFRERVKTRKIVVESLYAGFKDLDNRLFDLATGGKFQTHVMEADEQTADEIVQVVSELRMILRESKIARYWVN